MVGCKSAAMCAGANNFNQHQCVNMISITCLLASLAICSLSCYLSIRACRTSRLAARPWERRWRWSVSDQHRRLTRWWRSLPRVAWIQTRTRSALIQLQLQLGIVGVRNRPNRRCLRKWETRNSVYKMRNFATFDIWKSVAISHSLLWKTRYIITKYKSDHVSPSSSTSWNLYDYYEYTSVRMEKYKA